MAVSWDSCLAYNCFASEISVMRPAPLTPSPFDLVRLHSFFLCFSVSNAALPPCLAYLDLTVVPYKDMCLVLTARMCKDAPVHIYMPFTLLRGMSRSAAAL